MASVELDIPRLIDAHHHLWDLSAGRYPWLQGPPEDPTDPTGVGMLQRDYLVPDLMEDTAGLPLIASVHVEAAYDPADPVAETRWLQKVSDVTGFPHAIVANAYLERSDVTEQLKQHAEAPNLRGIRQMLDRNPWTGASEETSLFSDPAWHRGLSLLAERHLVFDMQVLPSQLPEAARAAADHPDVVFALNHGGYHVPYSEEAERLWRQGIAEIAQCRNVVVKASGYETVDPAWPQQGLDEYVETLLDAFGPERVLFASNFPVDRRTISYRQLLEMNRIATRNLDDQDRDRFFCANAQRVYSVPNEHRARQL